MSSTFFGLNIAGSGLRAANAALNTTANNISNAQTVGYSKQQVIQEASQALRTFTTYGCAGAGVDTIAIERIREEFYDIKYWTNQTKLGEYESKEYYTKTLEEYFSDDGTTGFKSLFDKMSTSLQSVITNSSSSSSKKTFIAACNTITDYFNSMYGNLQQMQSDVNLELKQSFDQLNSIAQKVATLNKQINVIEMSGSMANELRDQRDKLVDELSEYVDVKVTETPIYDTANPERETGANRYLLTIAGGQTLVDCNDYNTITYTAKTNYETTNQTDIDGLYNFTWSNGNEFSMTNASLGGKIAGLIQLRDGNNGVNFTGKVTSFTAATTTEDSKITIKASSDDLNDMKKCTLPSNGGIINVNNTLYYFSSWEYDENTQEFTFTMDDDKCDKLMDAGKVGTDSEIGDSISYQGIPYYMAQMNEWIRGFSDAVNSIFTSGYDTNGDSGCILFTGESPNSGQYTQADLDSATGDGLYEITAGNFCVNSSLIDDASLLGTRTDASSGQEECGKITEMVTMLSSASIYSFRNATAGEFLEMVLGDVALNASNATTFQKTYSGLQTTLGNQRTSISGVDEDEEAVSLVKYQNSYTLASKMIQTLTEVYDRLILETGV